MNTHYDLPPNAPPIPEMVDPGYPIHDNHYNVYSRLTGPPSHYDAVAFWYRPDHSESVYDQTPGMYSPVLTISPPKPDTAGVKHRRTRSGCYTCRSRRVKCDETRPICERCKKGDRECEFPAPTSSTSSKRVKNAEPRSPKQSHIKTKTKSGEVKRLTSLDTIKDEAENAETEKPTKPPRRPTLTRSRTHSSHSLSRKQKHRPSGVEISSPPVKEKSSPQSPTSSSSHSYPATPTSLPSSSCNNSSNTTANLEAQARQTKIKALRPDIQKYLNFHRDHMTHYHYFFKLDPTDFVHTEFIDQALSYEPLLYAVVGFAAYHYLLRQPDASLVCFLHFHSKALVLLRKSLEKQAQYTEAMLLTVLQLATVEEYLGDWVNLVGHHKAGYTMLMALYPKPELMMTTEVGRRIFSWYARFDLMAGLMAGGSPRLDRRWFEANDAWYAAAVDNDPESDLDVNGILASFVASNRLLGFDMARLFARMQQTQMAQASSFPSSISGSISESASTLNGPPDVQLHGQYLQQQKLSTSSLSSSTTTSPSFSPSASPSSSLTPPGNTITLEQFHTEHASILARLENMKTQLESLNDDFFTITSFPAADTHPYDPTVDIVDPYIPGGLFKGVLWNLNFMWLDWYAIDQMQKHQVALLLQQPLPLEELAFLSLQQCRIYEAIDRYADAPEGAILGTHASLGLATLFLNKDEKHIMWARRKLADIERLGYVFPEKYRKQMALIWGLSRDQLQGDESNSVEDWWLPDREGMLPILQEIRRVVSERHGKAGGTNYDNSKNRSDRGTGVVSATANGESETSGSMIGFSNQADIGEAASVTAGCAQDVRDLKAIFTKLDLQCQAAAGVQVGASTNAKSNPTAIATATMTRTRVDSAVKNKKSIQNSSVYDKKAAANTDHNYHDDHDHDHNHNTDTDTDTDTDADTCYEQEHDHEFIPKDPSRMSGIWPSSS